MRVRERKRSTAQRAVAHTWRTSGRVFEQFCENSSIHGVKYIVDEESTWLERIAWILVFIAAVLFSAYFCYAMWRKWEDSPVLMSLETTRYPLSNIPFPAVTICNVNKVSKQRLEVRLAQDPRFENVSYRTVQRTLRYMTKLDRAIDRAEDLQMLDELYASVNVTQRDLFEILKLTAPDCNSMVLDCTWQGLTKNCYEELSFLPTDDGLCCVFNGAVYIDPDLDIHSKVRPEQLFVGGNGYRQGLSLVLEANVEDYSVTNGKYDGFKVLVHATQKYPDVADRGFVISPGMETFVGVKGTTSDTAPEISDKVSAKKRNCRVGVKEEALNYFPRYSQQGCIIECAAKALHANFGCRPFFLRAPAGTPLCDFVKYENVSDLYERVRSDPVGNGCDCPPPCTDEWFEPEISASSFPGHGFNLSRTFERLANKLGLTGLDVHQDSYFKTNVAMLHVFYKDRTGIRYKTDIRFGVEDFLTAMGGLLGLGMGLSFVSVVELFYFLFLRVFCHKRYGSTTEVAELPPVALSYQSAGSAKSRKPSHPNNGASETSLSNTETTVVEDVGNP